MYLIKDSWDLELGNLLVSSIFQAHHFSNNKTLRATPKDFSILLSDNGKGKLS